MVYHLSNIDLAYVQGDAARKSASNDARPALATTIEEHDASPSDPDSLLPTNSPVTHTSPASYAAEKSLDVQFFVL